MKKTFFLMAICLLVISSVYAQFGSGLRVKLVSGDIKSLNGVREYDLKFEYSDLKVGGTDEQDYLNDKVTEKNKKETGTGDKFKKEWFANREAKFEPKFEELFNKIASSYGVKGSKNNKEAKYTIIVNTDYIEPGFNVGITRKPAFINVSVKIVDNANPSESVAKILLTNVPGQDAVGLDFDASYRISEAYAKAGKELGHYIIKNSH